MKRGKTKRYSINDELYKKKGIVHYKASKREKNECKHPICVKEGYGFRCVDCLQYFIKEEIKLKGGKI